MKKTYSILLAVASLVAIVPFAQADGDDTEIQEGRDYVLDGAIAYNKQISVPDGDGIYTITLESFATGSSTKTQQSLRSDIVLVLDVSGSMNTSLGDGTESYQARPSQNYSYNSYGNNTFYYLHTDGEYYPVKSYRNNSWNRFRLYYTVNSTDYYLSGTGVTTTPPDNVRQSNNTIWTGVLYEYGATTRLDALKVAVQDFIDLIDQNDTENAPDNQERLGNQIAIVTYSEGVTTEQSLTPLTNAGTIKQTVFNLTATGGTNTHLGMERANEILSSNNSTAQIKTCVLFTDGNPGAYGSWDSDNGRYWGDAQDPYKSENNQQIYQYTWYSANKTIEYANSIKNLTVESEEITEKRIANVFTVSIIPPGSEYTDVYLGKTSSDWLGATNMGSITVTRSGGGYGGYTYTTTGWKSPKWDNGNGSRNPKSKDYSTTDDDTEHIDFSLTATTADELREAFATVASQSGGSALPMTEESIAEVDVVSQSFVIPSDVDPEDIVIKIAKCSTKVAKTFIEDNVTKTEKFFVFYDPIEIDIFSDPKVLSGYKYTKVVKDNDGNIIGTYPNTPIDESLALSFSKSKPELKKEDMVMLTGFNYGALFCGPVYAEGWDEKMEGSDAHIVDWTGYKVILEIPIKMNPEAVGGPDVDTNGPGSGIKIGNSLIPFTSPHVSLPVNIWIRKDGLEVGESARFTIQRAVIPESWKDADWEKPSDSTDPVYDNLGWENVSSVFVTRHSGQEQSGINAPKTKAIGLPSVDDHDNEFIYRIIENTDWSWSYTPGTTKIFTTDQLETNPFIFYNTKKTEKVLGVRNAESKVTNTFKNGDFVVEGVVKKTVNANHVGFDDSKSNGRAVIEVSTSANNQQ